MNVEREPRPGVWGDAARPGEIVCIEDDRDLQPRRLVPSIDRREPQEAACVRPGVGT